MSNVKNKSAKPRIDVHGESQLALLPDHAEELVRDQIYILIAICYLLKNVQLV